MTTLETLLIVAGTIFAIGVFGVLTRRNLVIVVMSLELMFHAVVLSAVGTAFFTQQIGETDAVFQLSGHILSITVIAVTAVEAALFLALIFAFYRHYNTVSLNDAGNLRG